MPLLPCTLSVLFTLLSAVPELPDLSTVRPDLTTPVTTDESPAAGRRVRATTPGWEGTRVHHTLYLPVDWHPGVRLPIIAEYAGNGGYRNDYGDTCAGTVEGCSLGYGLSAGRGHLWVCLPYVEVLRDGAKGNATKWWGDVAETHRYALATLQHMARTYGGDMECVVLAGFSRGSIGAHYVGLHDDAIAPVWRAFFCHSHYDGVREGWPYPAADRPSALARVQRLHGRPVWISHEGTTAAIESYVSSTGVQGDFTFQPIPFRNHSDRWVLRDLPERKAAREWLRRVTVKR